MNRSRPTPLEVSRASSFACRALLLCLVAGCSNKHIDLARDPLGGGGRDASTRDASLPVVDGSVSEASMPQIGDAAMSRADAAPVARCGAGPCACDDGLDNDGDGLIDGFDPECTGALDENEATFATGKLSKAKNCRDCFWDEDQGTGNDSCRYPSACLRGDSPNGNGSCSSCEVSPSCVDTCAARTPSGCDCFGCCEVIRPNGVRIAIEFSERCSIANIADEAACPRCMQSTQCRNPCGRCELCPGRTLADLPADCRTQNPPNRCEERQPVCGTSADCTTDQYCQLGCCFAPLL